MLYHAVNMGNDGLLKLAVSIPDVGIFARTNNGETVFKTAAEMGYIDGPSARL